MLQPLLLEDNESVTPVKQDVEKPALQLPSIETNAGLQEDSGSESIIQVEDSSGIFSSVQETMPENLTTMDVENVDGHSNSTPTDLVLANASIVETSSLVSDPVPHVVQALAGPVSARLAAVHHLSQAIKSLRWQRQLQDVGEKRVAPEHVGPKRNSH